MSELQGPVPVSERVAILDVVRGVALLGILIMNMPGFSNSFFIEADGSHLWSSPVDRVAETVREMLFSGKFNSMFSLLFGIGFTIQFARMQERAPGRATWLYTRRLLVLLALGLIHAAVFWTGDILHIYAILGLLLLAVLRRASDRTIYVLIGLLILYPAVGGYLRLVLTTPELTAQLVAEAKAWEASNNIAYGTGSFAQAAQEHARELTYYYAHLRNYPFLIAGYAQMGTTMLLGLLIGRNQWYRHIPELLPVIRRLQWWALAIGVVCSLAFGAVWQIERTPGPSALKVLGSITYVLSRLAMMTFYVLTIVRLAQRPEWQRRFAPLADTGRMPLTNYLLQTLICTALFYGWGLGLWGRVGPAIQLGLAIGIFFLVQVPLSRLWLRRFEYGPLEYAWRVLTYGRLEPKPQPVAS